MFGGNSNAICGEKHVTQLEGYSENINSKDIIKFSYSKDCFFASAAKRDEKVEIICNGGGKYNRRDGSLFGIKYETNDDSIFKKLQEVIDNNNETRGNGHCVTVDGLPSGLGDTLDIEYSSGKKIYKHSNQSPTVSFETSDKIYEIFHELVKKDGYDFNTEGSNVKLFDDADYEYVQGTWKGKHFGSEVEVTFTGNNVTISIDGKVTDDSKEYTIYQGNIVLNKLKENVDVPKDYHDYEYFNGISTMSKKNYFTMTAYFMSESYSTCDLMNYDKEKPNDIE